MELQQNNVVRFLTLKRRKVLRNLGVTKSKKIVSIVFYKITGNYSSKIMLQFSKGISSCLWARYARACGYKLCYG